MDFFWLKLGLSFTKSFHLGVCIRHFCGLTLTGNQYDSVRMVPFANLESRGFRGCVTLKPYSAGLMGVKKIFYLSRCVESFSVTPGEVFSDAVSLYVVLGALGNRLLLC